MLLYRAGQYEITVDLVSWRVRVNLLSLSSMPDLRQIIDYIELCLIAHWIVRDPESDIHCSVNDTATHSDNLNEEMITVCLL